MIMKILRKNLTQSHFFMDLTVIVHWKMWVINQKIICFFYQSVLHTHTHTRSNSQCVFDNQWQRDDLTGRRPFQATFPLSKTKWLTAPQRRPWTNPSLLMLDVQNTKLNPSNRVQQNVLSRSRDSKRFHCIKNLSPIKDVYYIISVNRDNNWSK